MRQQGDLTARGGTKPSRPHKGMDSLTPVIQLRGKPGSKYWGGVADWLTITEPTYGRSIRLSIPAHNSARTGPHALRCLTRKFKAP